MSVPVTWPGPDATHEEVQAFFAERAPSPKPAHEAPAVANGPSIVCNACGVNRVSLLSPFCRRCLAAMDGEL